MMVRLPKLSLVLSLFARLVIAAPAPAQIGEPFSSPDGMMTFTSSTYDPATGVRHVTFTASGTEVAAGHGEYTDGGDGSFDFDGTFTNGTVTLVFSEADTLTISFEATIVDPAGPFRGTWSVIDGTGAFAGADGGDDLSGVVMTSFLFPEGGTASFDLEGSI